jgi:flagellin-like hook-associated protein FlgL
MPIVLNTNATATEATFNLSKANESLRRTIARLSSGNRITKPIDDAGGLAVAYKLQSSVKRTEAALNNHQNALSYLQVQDGVLEAIGDIVDRMSELRTMAADVSKNAADVENYSKEFLELQDQLHQMKREKFNGVELFAVEEEWEELKGLNKAHLKINGELFSSGTTAYGDKERYEYFDDPDQTKRTLAAYDKYEFELYTHPSGVEEDGNIKLNIVNLQFVLGLKESHEVDKDFDPIDRTYTAATGVYTANDGQDIVQTNQTINLGGLQQLGSQSYQDSESKVTASGAVTTPNTASGNALTEITTASNQDDTRSKFTNLDSSGNISQNSYIKDITEISIEEFTNIIEKIADVRAENGAEQQRVNQSLQLHQNNLVNLEAAHGRIMDVDVALESSRLARSSVKVQASAAMVAQANQMSAVALSLLQ